MLADSMRLISNTILLLPFTQCKSFKYFLEVVAPDMLEKYPPVQIEYASGAVS